MLIWMSTFYSNSLFHMLDVKADRIDSKSLWQQSHKLAH